MGFRLESLQEKVRTIESPGRCGCGRDCNPACRERQRAAFDGKWRKRRQFRTLLFDRSGEPRDGDCGTLLDCVRYEKGGYYAAKSVVVGVAKCGDCFSQGNLRSILATPGGCTDGRQGPPGASLFA